MAHEQDSESDTSDKAARRQSDLSLSLARASPTQEQDQSTIPHTPTVLKSERDLDGPQPRERERDEQQTRATSNNEQQHHRDLERKKVFERGRCSLPRSFALSLTHTRTSQALARDPHKMTTYVLACSIALVLVVTTSLLVLPACAATEHYASVHSPSIRRAAEVSCLRESSECELLIMNRVCVRTCRKLPIRSAVNIATTRTAG